MLKITILYDNTACLESLTADWGFACLVETESQNILFDTGAKGWLLLENLWALQVEPLAIDAVFISHDHWDHTGGLADFLHVNPVDVYLPANCRAHGIPMARVRRINAPGEISDGIYSTGALGGIEQSLVFRKAGGVVAVSGCAHPGVEAILAAAARFGPVRALVGGLHGFDNLSLLNGLETICPTHCTRHIKKIKTRFPAAFISGGAGRVLEF